MTALQPGHLFTVWVSDGRGKVCPRLDVGQESIDQAADGMLEDAVDRSPIIIVMRVDSFLYALVFVDALRPVLFVFTFDAPFACTRALRPLRKSMIVALGGVIVRTGNSMVLSFTLSTA